MSYAYDEMYLPDVQKNLGFLFQFMLSDMDMSPDSAQAAFLESEIPGQIEIANPDILCGKSGYELAMLVFPKENLTQKIEKALRAPFYPEAEYWAGFILAYCHWKNNKAFSSILEKCPLSQILQSYHLLHEADVSKAEEIIMRK